MNDIKRIALLVMIVSFYFSSFSNYVSAATSYNHSELLEYEGYGQAVYESIVEQSAFVTGQYTDNKEYVSQSIDQIIEYADFWKSDFENWDSTCDFDFTGCMRSMFESGTAYALTVGDWFKNLFNDYGDEYHPVEFDNTVYNQFVTAQEGVRNTYKVNPGYVMLVSRKGENSPSRITETHGYRYYTTGGSWMGDLTGASGVDDMVADIYFYIGNVSYSDRFSFYGADVLEIYNYNSSGNFGAIIALASRFDVTITFESVSSGETIAPTPSPVSNDYDDFRNYVNNNPSKVVAPQPKPYLVCPNDTKIQMSISGSTFLAVDGTTMIVNKDGTAEVNSEICNLAWEKPIVKYNEDGKAVIETDEGEREIETGKIVAGTEPPVACDGVLCFLSEIVKSITGLVTKVLDGITALFVPDDLDFLKEEFSRMSDSLTEKIAITEDLKSMVTGLFVEDTTNPLGEITLDLPILNEPLQFGHLSIINEGVPILKKVISAICVLYTLLYVYRKFTGRGGVMEK